MKHTVEVVSYRKLSDGQVRFYLRCCGQSDTDHSHVVAAEVAAEPKKLKASLAVARATVSKQHEDMQKVEALALKELGL